uniref:NmrA-like domain-containing protein n=1 Tax=Fibrocapsa japonica TaxID=94617 RepID=A0A7S2XW41_9STRA|mmetsp:Transcript_14340/g.21099  ORF Transcript_14340/g.21099 Transcript_14340/m.21099 type:complete len:305 (+) Transcript_14340:63-977(+)
MGPCVSVLLNRFNDDAIMVLQADHPVGAATVAFLLGEDDFPVVAGVQDTSNPDLGDLKNAKLVRATIGQPKLEKVFKENNVGRLLLVISGSEDVGKKVKSTLKSAAAAGVGYIGCVSTATASYSGTLFANLYAPIEGDIKKSKIPFTIFRLTMPLDIYLTTAEKVRTMGKFVFPLMRSVRCTFIDVEDAAAAIGVVMLEPLMHLSRTYTFAGTRHTVREFVYKLGSALGKEIKYECVSLSDWRKDMIEEGLPTWRVEGGVEVIHMCNKVEYDFSSVDRYPMICKNRRKTKLETWINEHLSFFQS